MSKLFTLVEKMLHKKKIAMKYLSIIILWIIMHKIYCKLYRKFKKLPQGPNGLPFIGATLLGLIQAEHLSKYLANKYNKFITFHWIGTQNVAIIHNYKIAKQIFSNKHCQDREPIFYSMIANEYDIIRVKYGNQWKDRRKLIKSVLLTMEDSNYVDINIQRFIQKYTSQIISSNMKQKGYINTKDLYISIRHLTFSMILKVMFGKELSCE
eukprot:528473_1